LENLLGEWWDEEQHRQPLLQYLRGERGQSPSESRPQQPPGSLEAGV
jgi:hypothetical protein